MTTFYLVRHGKTELNIAERFQGGAIDSPLIEEGIQQAQQAGKHLSDIVFDFVAVSTQKRAVHTASYIIGENNFLNGATVAYFDGLREITFGSREGEKIDRTDTQTNYLRTNPALYDPSSFGGEELDDAVERAQEVLEKISQKYPNGKILIVAHGALLIILMNYLLGKDKSKWREGGPLANTSISIIRKKHQTGTYELKLLNDVSYQK